MNINPILIKYNMEKLILLQSIFLGIAAILYIMKQWVNNKKFLEYLIALSISISTGIASYTQIQFFDFSFGLVLAIITCLILISIVFFND